MSDYSDVEDDYADSPHSGQGAVADDPKRHARAQHNALERRRRDNIKDMYSSLRDTVPEMNNERASRAVILKRAIDAIEVRAAANEELEAKKRRQQEKVAQLEAEINQIQEEMKNIEKKAELTEARPSLPPTPEMRFSAQQ